jgi:hypothetical protein
VSDVFGSPDLATTDSSAPFGQRLHSSDHSRLYHLLLLLLHRHQCSSSHRLCRPHPHFEPPAVLSSLVVFAALLQSVSTRPCVVDIGTAVVMVVAVTLLLVTLNIAFRLDNVFQTSASSSSWRHRMTSLTSLDPRCRQVHSTAVVVPAFTQDHRTPSPYSFR